MSHVLPATLFTQCRLTLSGVVSYPLIGPISGKCVGSPYEAHIPTGLRIQTLNLQTLKPPFGHVATIFRKHRRAIRCGERPDSSTVYRC
ncbi:hypothetical protein NHX12_008684 [Muraenolepis orangiensis]|uniref:Uncharacterized protein n=1 Tax=Muraenolepis orangiensis TaxID=630683 RepID=A0A9Q0DPB4_9TELE|nr:hypothetical protein NHX12_008684 [Muraenolepis orangiensis]